MKRFLFPLLLAPLLLNLTGCGSTSTAESNYNTTDANGQQVSSVPWNKQESWEQGGQLGTALGH